MKITTVRKMVWFKPEQGLKNFKMKYNPTTINLKILRNFVFWIQVISVTGKIYSQYIPLRRWDFQNDE